MNVNFISFLLKVEEDKKLKLWDQRTSLGSKNEFYASVNDGSMTSHSSEMLDDISFICEAPSKFIHKHPELPEDEAPSR